MGNTLFHHFSHKGKSAALNSLEEAFQASKKSGFVWLDFEDPTQEALAPLTEKFGIHPLSIDDCIDEDQIPKMDVFPEYSFILFNYYTYENKALSIDELDLMIAPNFLITVHGHHSKISDFFSKLPDLIERSIAESSKGPDYLMHTILDYIVDKKFHAIEKLQDEIDLSEESIHKDAVNYSPTELIRIRNCLLSLRKSLFHEREILIKICRKDSPVISDKVIFYYRDIYDHLAKFFEFIEIEREMISNLFELFLSIRNNQLAELSIQANETMKKLTLITTIFMPLTLLAGIGGMSEWSMMTGAENWKIAYPVFMVIMGGFAFFNYLFLKWIKWI